MRAARLADAAPRRGALGASLALHGALAGAAVLPFLTPPPLRPSTPLAMEVVWMGEPAAAPEEQAPAPSPEPEAAPVVEAAAEEAATPPPLPAATPMPQTPPVAEAPHEEPVQPPQLAQAMPAPSTPPEPAVADAAPAPPPPPPPPLPARATPAPPVPPEAPRRPRSAPSRSRAEAAITRSGATAPPAAAVSAPPMPAAMPAAPPTGLILVTAPRYRRPPAPPRYPPRAIELGLTGTVLVRARVGPAGGTEEIRVWRSSGQPLLDAAALAAVRDWAFEPASVEGRRVEAWVEVPVHFRLN
jgi:protein TonB